MINFFGRIRCLHSQTTPFDLLQTGHAVEAVTCACTQFGLFNCGNSDNDEVWRRFASSLLQTEIDATSSFIAISKVLASSNVSIGSFWDSFGDRMASRLISEKVQLHDLMTVIECCNAIDYTNSVITNKFVNYLMDNENLWIFDFSDLIKILEIISFNKLLIKNNKLLNEIENRLIIEIDDSMNFELINKLLISFSIINKYYFIKKELIKKLIKKINEISLKQKCEISLLIGNLDFRNSTFFKLLFFQLFSQPRLPPGVGTVHLAMVCLAMKRLKFESEVTEWWDKKSDFNRLMKIIEKRINSKSIIDEFKFIDSKGILVLSELLNKSISNKLAKFFLMRLKELLKTDPLSKSHRDTAQILSHLARHDLHEEAKWFAEWICGNVYILSMREIVMMNSAFIKFNFKDKNYFKIWIPYFLERLNEEMTKEDISAITHTFNKCGFTDNEIGRNFFYHLGKRFQELSVSSADTRSAERVTSIGRLG